MSAVCRILAIAQRLASDYWPDDVRSLFLATEEDGQLVYSGAVGTGFTDRELSRVLELRRLSRSRNTPTSPARPPKEARACRWVEPRLLVEVEFIESGRAVRFGTHLTKAFGAISGRRMFT